MTKPKLHFTIKMAKELEACQEGLDMLYKYLADNSIQHDDDTKFNVLLLLKSNSVHHLWWLLRRVGCGHKEVYVELANRCAKRAKEYCDYSNLTDCDTSTSHSDYAACAAAHAAAYAACAAAHAAAYAAAYAARAAAAAACAARSANDAASAADAAYTADATTEREKQAEDFRELLDDGDIE